MKGEGELLRWSISQDLHHRMTLVAREFRKEQTPSEAVLWQELRRRKLDGLKLRRQQPIGPFVVDFLCATQRLVVEVDGGVHADQQFADRQRQELLESLGLRFIRLPADLVEEDLQAALKQIRGAIRPASAPPSPFKGEGAGGRG